MRSLRTYVWAFALAAGFYLLLIDTVDLPELLAMLAICAVAAGAYLIARHERVGEATIQGRWLLGAGRPVATIPRQVLWVSVEAIGQLLRPRASRGRFRAVSFATPDGAETIGRVALAEGFGSLAPNTIVIGVDEEQGLLLVHQLRVSGGRDELDVMRLG
jgi:hypothetical protein